MMTNGTINELSPCPFCGGKAMIMQLPVGSKAQGLYSVGCIEDTMCLGHISHIAMRFVSKRAASNTWNTRRLPRYDERRS